MKHPNQHTLNAVQNPTSPVRIVHRPACSRHGMACWLAIPSSASTHRHLQQAEPALVVIHGIQRGAEEMVRAFAARAVAEGRIVIAPVFDEANWRGYQRVVINKRADLALIALLDELAIEGLIHARRFTLFGFSGGAQFAHRFAMLYPHRIEHLVAAAAGWYTLPERDVGFPCGVGAEDGARRPWGPRFGAGLDSFLRVPVTVLVGALDNARDAATRSTPELDRLQGHDRLARARNWTRAVGKAAQARRLPVRVQLRILEGCGHSFMECVRQGGLVHHVLAPLPALQTDDPTALAV